MSKVYLICGKVCSGKTYLGKQMADELQAVRLSVDERMLAMNPSGLFGDQHDQIAAQMRHELTLESVSLVLSGVSVILDWGFWTKKSREEASRFYQKHGIAYEWHYVDVSDERWEMNISHRNQAIQDGCDVGFIVDEGLRQKLLSLFETPSRDEIDVWHSLG